MDDAGLTLFDVSQGNGEEARFRRASYLLSLAGPHRPPDAGTIGRRNPPNATIMRNIRRPGTSGNQRDPEMREQTRLRHSAGVGISGTNLVAIRWQFRYLFFLDFCK